MIVLKAWLQDERALGLLDKQEEISNTHGWTMTQTALAWILTNPVVTSAIIGADNITQLKDSLTAAGCRLAADEKQILDDASAWT